MNLIARFGGIVSISVDKNMQKFVSVEAMARLHLDQVSNGVRSRVIKTFLRGYSTTNGLGDELYRVLCKVYGLAPISLARNYANFVVPKENIDTVYKAMQAAWLLCPKARKEFVNTYVYSRKRNSTDYADVHVTLPAEVERDYFFNVYVACGYGPNPKAVEQAIASIINGDIIQVQVK